MRRVSAESVDEICTRHAAAARVEGKISTDPVEEYGIVVRTSGILPVAASLNECFAEMRGGYEIEEVYVQTTEQGSYEPLEGWHLGQFGAWAAVFRRIRPQADPRVVGIMLAKDEADVVADVVAAARPSLARLYYYAADEETHRAIAASSANGWASAVVMPMLADHVVDGARQVLLDQVRADRGDDPRPAWVMNIQGDEVYADDLLHHVRLAQRERATTMTAQVATFVLHESQREGWDWSLPLEQRLTHYIWDFGEHAGFLDFPWVHYRIGEHMRAHPHGIYPAKWASARPVRRHCPFRNPDQARARIEDRLKSGWQPHYANYADIFMKDEAAGRKVKRYFGWYPEAERVEGIW